MVILHTQVDDWLFQEYFYHNLKPQKKLGTLVVICLSMSLSMTTFFIILYVIIVLYIFVWDFIVIKLISFMSM